MTTVFLDLDGTLTDPAPGITAAIIHALTQLGHDPPPAAELHWMIGPPLIDSFAILGVADPAAALDLYRQHYAAGALFQNRVYDGIPEALDEFRTAGRQLCLATAKPHVYARRITAHFGLAQLLDHEFGPELDGTRADKADLLAHALDLTGTDPKAAVMVGDRIHDFEAAKNVGMACVAVSWGYGTPQERAQASAICDRPDQLPEIVQRLLQR